MEYLPTFTPKMAQMLVNIPYMEHLGLKIAHLYLIYLLQGVIFNSHVNLQEGKPIANLT